MNRVHVRPDTEGDAAAIAIVNDAAFGGSEESRIIEAIRRSERPRISLVAVDGLIIVGHILFTPVAIEGSDSTVAMGLGPMAVVPGRQRQGVGSILVRAGLSECEQIGCHVVVVVGHPQFYPRFGFRPASSFDLRCEYPVPDDVFMALELTPGALGRGGGLVRYAPEFAE